MTILCLIFAILALTVQLTHEALMNVSEHEQWIWHPMFKNIIHVLMSMKSDDYFKTLIINLKLKKTTQHRCLVELKASFRI